MMLELPVNSLDSTRFNFLGEENFFIALFNSARFGAGCFAASKESLTVN